MAQKPPTIPPPESPLAQLVDDKPTPPTAPAPSRDRSPEDNAARESAEVAEMIEPYLKATVQNIPTDLRGEFYKCTHAGVGIAMRRLFGAPNHHAVEDWLVDVQRMPSTLWPVVKGIVDDILRRKMEERFAYLGSLA